MHAARAQPRRLVPALETPLEAAVHAGPDALERHASESSILSGSAQVFGCGTPSRVRVDRLLAYGLIVREDLFRLQPGTADRVIDLAFPVYRSRVEQGGIGFDARSLVTGWMDEDRAQEITRAQVISCIAYHAFTSDENLHRPTGFQFHKALLAIVAAAGGTCRESPSRCGTSPRRASRSSALPQIRTRSTRMLRRRGRQACGR